MTPRTFPQKEKEASVQGLLFDLEATARNVRLSAVIQLSLFLNRSEVMEAFQERLKVEDDEEVRFHLEAGYRKEGFKSFRLTIPDELKNASSPDDFVKKFLASGPEDQQRLIRSLPEMKQLDPGKIFLAIIQASSRSENILSVLSAPESLFSSEVTHSFLANFLKHKNCLIAQRSLQILGNIAPGRSLPHLPLLLMHPAISVRAMAIIVLNRICPPEAKRLLGEFLESDSPSVRGIGLSMFFYFPFEEISGILFDLLDRGSIPDSSYELIRVLVKSNPDKVFMAQLAMLICRRPGESALAEELLGISAEGMNISKIDTENPVSIAQKFLAGAQKRLNEILPTSKPERKSDTAKSSLATELKPDVKEEPPCQSPPAGQEFPTEFSQQLKFLEELPNFDSSATANLAKMFGNAQEEPQKIRLAEIATKNAIKDERVVKALESYLAASGDKVVIAGINSLSVLAPKALVPHLPILCHHKSPIVVSLSIRKLRAFDGPGFFRRINEWVKDAHPLSRNAAILALTQMDFGQSKKYIFSLIQKSNDAKLIESFGNILLMNPESGLWRELRAMAENSTRDRKAYILKLADQVKMNYEQIAEMAVGEGWQAQTRAFLKELHLDEKADAVLSQIRKIHYQVKDVQWGDAISELLAKPLVLAVIIAFLAVYPLLGLFSKEKDPLEISKEKIPVVSQIKIPKGEKPLPDGTNLAGTLESYDPFNHYWKFRGVDGSFFKVIFQDREAKFHEGDTVSANLIYQGKTRTGYLLYKVNSYKKIGLSK